MAKVGQTIVLDASESYDEEQFPSKLIYHWNCLEIWPNYGENCIYRFNLANGSIDSHNFSVIVKESHRQVRWIVNVREGQRRANTSIIMDLVKPRAPTINFQSSAVSSMVNAESSIKISAMINIPENFSGVTTWITNDLNLSSISLTPLFHTVRVFSTSQTIITYLVLPPRSLKSGIVYTFTLLVTVVDANMNYTSAQSSSSQISISVNAPPMPGLFTVTPMSGIAMRDKFLFSCYQWFDIDLPISYQFSFVLSSDQRKNVIKGLSIVSSGISFLPEGNGANNFSLQVVADIYDNMNANYSINSKVFVHKFREETFNLSTYVLTTIKSSQTVDALLQGTSLATVMLNQANCSFAPNCTELNRRSCFYTSHTCGSCLLETMIGFNGDSNSPCYESTQVKENVLQKCSNNCSGHGSCNFFTIRTNAPLKLCYEGDLSCSARCICDVGYLRSVICDKSDQIIEEKMKLRELVIQGIQSFINRQDDTQQSLSSQVNSLIAISKISEELSSSTVSSLLSIASRILELVTEDRRRCMTSIDYFPALINGLGEAVIFNQNQMSTNKSVYYSQITTISQLLKNYSSLIIEEMVPSQISNQIIERTFRLIATKLDLNHVEKLNEASSCSRNSSVTLPQTSTETFYGLTPTSISFPICTSETSLSLAASSLYSDLLNNSSFLTNPLYLHLSSFPCSNSSLPQCRVQFTIDNADKQAETLYSARNQTIVCEKGEFTVQEVNCGDGQQNFNVSCRGIAETLVAKCPVHNLTLVCRELAMMTETIDIGCKLIYQGTRNITCSCPLKHSSVVLNSEAQIQSYEVNYVSMLKSTWGRFHLTAESAGSLNNQSIQESWEVIVILGSFLTCVIISMLLSSYADRMIINKIESEEKLKIEVSSAVHNSKKSLDMVSDVSVDTISKLSEESLPEILLSSQITLLQRIWAVMKKHHRWFGVIYYFSKRFPRILRVMSLATNIIIMLFMQSLTYSFTNGDDGSCAKFTNEVDCLRPRSSYEDGSPMCYWIIADNESGGECHFIEPDNSVTVIVFVAIFSGMVSTPIALCADWIIQHILAAPLAESCRVAPSHDRRRKNTDLNLPNHRVEHHHHRRYHHHHHCLQSRTKMVEDEMNELHQLLLQHRETIFVAKERKEFEGTPSSVIFFLHFVKLL